MWVSRMLYAVAELEVADALPDGDSATAAKLAAAVDADPDRLQRVLRALAAHGVFAAVDDRRFAHTDLSRLLRSDHPNSVRNLALMHGAPWQWEPWNHLTDGIRTGASPFVAAFGKDAYTYFAEDNPASRAVYQAALTEIAAATDGPLADALDLSGAHTVVHVGGRTPDFLASLVRRHPHLDAVLFGTHATLRGSGAGPDEPRLTDRIRLVPGDYLRAVDCTADVYLLKQLLHFHDDETCVGILRNCAANAKPGARIVVNERVLDERYGLPYASLHDVMMFVVLDSGRDRTEREYADLFGQAGLAYSHITPTPSGMCWIEAGVLSTE